jgi:hydroxyacylglutathione hydrolase
VVSLDRYKDALATTLESSGAAICVRFEVYCRSASLLSDLKASTPEHICILVTDHTRGEEPWFVLSGHTLMVGDLGRTELATSAEEGAKQLFRSARRLKELPDDVEVLAGAYAGSVCGRRLSGKPWSTIGFEKRHNQAFMIADEAEFIRFMVSEIPPAPPEAAKIRAANSGVTAAAA